MGFGGGALVAGPLSDALLKTYDGSIAAAFLTLAAIYFVMMMLGAFTVRLPAEGWKPDGWEPQQEAEKRLVTRGNVTAANAIRTPQFWLLWVVLFCNVTAGIGILEQASPMIQDHFDTVAAAAAAGFVGLLSLCNMAGRIGWSSTSDVIGRKPMYMIFLGVGALLYFLLASTGTASVAWFVLLTGVILSFYGGGFATVPAYLKDLFGTLQVGAIHGRLLTAWSAAGVAGPLIVNAIADSETAAGKSGADLYTLSLYIMVGVLAVGFVANLLIRPVAERHLEPAEAAPRRFEREPQPVHTRS
jgi:MFS family permease